MSRASVVLFAYVCISSNAELNMSTKNTVTKFYHRSYIVVLSHLCNAIKKMLNTIACHRHFNRD